jgi:hypothetical protein
VEEAAGGDGGVEEGRGGQVAAGATSCCLNHP